MTTATTILATAHTLGQIRKACRAQCVGMDEKLNVRRAIAWSQYRFADRSRITIDGSKIKVGPF